MIGATNFIALNWASWIFLLIFLNVLIYVLSISIFFSLLFLTDVSLFKVTTNFKMMTQTSISTNLMVFIFLALAGLPPFLSFIGKFFLFMILFYNSNWILICVFFLFNCFVIYFYIQHLRLLFTRVKNFSVLIKKNFPFVNSHLIFIILYSVFFLIFGLFFVSDLFIYLSPLVMH